MQILVIQPTAKVGRPDMKNTTKIEIEELEITSPISDRDLAAGY